MIQILIRNAAGRFDKRRVIENQKLTVTTSVPDIPGKYRQFTVLCDVDGQPLNMCCGWDGKHEISWVD